MTYKLGALVPGNSGEITVPNSKPCGSSATSVSPIQSHSFLKQQPGAEAFSLLFIQPQPSSKFHPGYLTPVPLHKVISTCSWTQDRSRYLLTLSWGFQSCASVRTEAACPCGYTRTMGFIRALGPILLLLPHLPTLLPPHQHPFHPSDIFISGRCCSSFSEECSCPRSSNDHLFTII